MHFIPHFAANDVHVEALHYLNQIDAKESKRHVKALGNYVSNLAHTYFLIIFAKIVNIWTIVTDSAESWVKGHPVTLREVKNDFP